MNIVEYYVSSVIAKLGNVNASQKQSGLSEGIRLDNHIDSRHLSEVRGK